MDTVSVLIWVVGLSLAGRCLFTTGQTSYSGGESCAGPDRQHGPEGDDGGIWSQVSFPFSFRRIMSHGG